MTNLNSHAENGESVSVTKKNRYYARGYLLPELPPQNVGALPIKLIHAEIESENFQKIKTSRDICLTALGLEERFQLVVDNFMEWETELFEQAQTHLLRQTTRFERLQQMLSLNRRLANLLSTFRLYFDQTNKEILRVFGDSSPELAAISKFKNQIYDTSFEFRFFEQLRNHVQHSGLPVEEISFNSAFADQSANPDTRFTVIPFATWESLSENDKFKKKILDEIKTKGGKIDLRLPAREYMSSVTLIHDEVRKLFSKKLNQARDFYLKSIQNFSEINGYPVKHPKLQACNDSGELVETVDLISDFIDEYDILLRRYRIPKNISRSFASNAIS